VHRTEIHGKLGRGRVFTVRGGCSLTEDNSYFIVNKITLKDLIYCVDNIIAPHI